MSLNEFIFLMMGTASVCIMVVLIFMHPHCKGCGKIIHKNSRVCPVCGREQWPEKDDGVD